MGQEPSIKIRVLPRAGKQESQKAIPQADEDSRIFRRRMVYFVSISCFAIAGVLLWIDQTQAPAKVVTHGATSLSSVTDPSKTAVNRHLNDLHLRAKMMTRQAEVASENARAKSLSATASSTLWTPDQRALGVHLDQEDTVARIAEDLNHRPNGGYSESVEDLINSRLANRKWLNELDKAERINYIRNFLRSAYDRGYEVQLDQNLVVVSVRRINPYQRVNIDNVINKMAQQGK